MQVTQANESVRGHNGLSTTPSQFYGRPNRPVENVSWNDIQIFLTRLNDRTASGRLPSGWFVVCQPIRNGNMPARQAFLQYSWGTTITTSNGILNYGIDQTTDVGQYNANLGFSICMLISRNGPGLVQYDLCWEPVGSYGPLSGLCELGWLLE